MLILPKGSVIVKSTSMILYYDTLRRFDKYTTYQMMFLLTKVHRKIICAYIRYHSILQMMFRFYAPCTIKCTMLFMKGSHGADHWGKSASFFATCSDVSLYFASEK